MLPQFVLEYGEGWGRHYVFRKLIPVWDYAKREEFFTAKVIWRFTSAKVQAVSAEVMTSGIIKLKMVSVVDVNQIIYHFVH